MVAEISKGRGDCVFSAFEKARQRSISFLCSLRFGVTKIGGLGGGLLDEARRWFLLLHLLVVIHVFVFIILLSISERHMSRDMVGLTRRMDIVVSWAV